MHALIYEAPDTAAGISILRESAIDCLLLNHRFSDRSGLNLLTHYDDAATAKPLPVILLTGIGNEPVALQAIKYGARDYLVTANVSLESLRQTIINAIEATALENQHRQASELLHKLSRAVEHSASSVLITDKNGVIEYVNPGFCRDAGGAISHFVAVGEDVTELYQTRADLERLAFYDMLTGLESHQLFRKRLEQALKLSQRKHEYTALLFLDLDNFKRINDSLGHDAGDMLLKIVARRLQDCAPQADCLARLGGDEFSLLLTDIEEPTHVSAIAQRILNALQQPIKLCKQEVIIGASLGITVTSSNGTDASELIKNADLAMYRAKAQGGNNYQFYTVGMNQEAAERLQLEQALRQALERSEFTLFFQPLMRLDTLRPVALEALVRWRHPERGIILPDRFIGIAEETGLIVPLGNWVLREACRQTKALDARGIAPLKMAINLSARQFRDPGLATTIASILSETQLEPERLKLELTESMLMHNIDEAIAIMYQLKDLGVALSIDDFGTGYSSLNFLKRFPIDTLKVDRCFVQDIPYDSDNAAITDTVIAMAHKLRLDVVAEGVETTEQLEFLQQNQCDFGQGYLFSRPLPLEKLIRLLE